MGASSLADVQGRLAQIYCIKLAVHDLCVQLRATGAESTLQRCVEIGHAATEAVKRQLPAPPVEIQASDAPSTSAHRLDLLTLSSVLGVHACARKLDRWAPLALSPLPLILSYKSEKSLYGTGCARSSHSMAGQVRSACDRQQASTAAGQGGASWSGSIQHPVKRSRRCAG